MDQRRIWSWATGCLTSLIIMLEIFILMVMGLLWGILLVPLMIGSIMFGQNVLFFMIGRFALKHQYHVLKNWVIGLWCLFTFAIAGFFLMIVGAGNSEFNWWFGISLMLIGIEYILILLANFIADHPQE